MIEGGLNGAVAKGLPPGHSLADAVRFIDEGAASLAASRREPLN